MGCFFEVVVHGSVVTERNGCENESYPFVNTMSRSAMAKSRRVESFSDQQTECGVFQMRSGHQNTLVTPCDRPSSGSTMREQPALVSHLGLLRALKPWRQHRQPPLSHHHHELRSSSTVSRTSGFIGIDPFTTLPPAKWRPCNDLPPFTLAIYLSKPDHATFIRISLN